MAAELVWQAQADLQPLNTLGLPARARALVSVSSRDELQQALQAAERQGLPVRILGGGSNLVLARDLAAAVIRPRLLGRQQQVLDAQRVAVTAGAGEVWHDFVCWTLAQGLFGLENLSLIPGTVGAAPIQNIGAYGVEVADRLLSVTVWDRTRQCQTELAREDCRFAYRDSLFKSVCPERYVVLAVTFCLSRQPALVLDYGDIRAELARRGIEQPTPADVAAVVCDLRRAKLPDPAVIGNAGSFFKNPVVSAAQAAELKARWPDLVSYPVAEGVKLAAGWLIERAGWKGHRAGPVGVHDRQALVLVHHGGGTGRELLALAEAIRTSVLERYGVVLEQEPLIWS